MKRIPLNLLQEAIYSLLTDPGINWKDRPAVYSNVPKQPKFPYVVFGFCAADDKGAKQVDIADYGWSLHIYSKQGGPWEVNNQADNITIALSNWPLKLADEGFKVLQSGIESYTVYEEATEGYQGVLVFKATIQNLKY